MTRHLRGLPRPVTAQTPLQRQMVAIGELFSSARAEIGRREYRVWLDTLGARVARETAALLDHEERLR